MCLIGILFNEKIPLATIDKPAKLFATFFRVNTKTTLRFLEGGVVYLDDASSDASRWLDPRVAPKFGS